MRELLKYSVLLITIGMVLFSCEHDPIEPDPVAGSPSTPVDNSCDSTRVYFKNDILPLIQSNCAYSPCHDQARTDNKGVILTTYSNILNYGKIESNDPEESELFERMTEAPDKVMPPSGALHYTDIDKIRKWIEQGYANDSCNYCDTNVFTFSRAVKPIIDAHCVGCHSGSGTLLTNYTQIKTQADNGKLLGTISHSQGFRAMPDNLPKLPDCEITQVRKWIETGAQNN